MEVSEEDQMGKAVCAGSRMAGLSVYALVVRD